MPADLLMPPGKPFPFMYGDAVLVDGVARGRIREIHPETSEVSVRLDEDNNKHRIDLTRITKA